MFFNSYFFQVEIIAAFTLAMITSGDVSAPNKRVHGIDNIWDWVSDCSGEVAVLVEYEYGRKARITRNGVSANHAINSEWLKLIKVYKVC